MSDFTDLWAKSASKPGTPVNASGAYDSFSSLSSVGSAKPAKKLESMSLHERQKHLLLQRGVQSDGVSSTGAWDGLDLLGGSIAANERGRGSVGNSLLDGLGDASASKPVGTTNSETDSIDELFDVFNMPPKPVESQATVSLRSSGSSGSSGEASDVNSADVHVNADLNGDHSNASSRPVSRTSSMVNSEHNLQANSRLSSVRNFRVPRKSDPRDPAIAELVDMGFSVEDAREALAHTDNGLDIQQAIEFLFSEAHKRSSGKPQENFRRPARNGNNLLASHQDVAKLATEFSSQFISKAGSFWNQGKKNLAKAIEQYNSPSPSNDGMPAWMRQSQKDSAMHGAQVEEDEQEAIGAATREAMDLERERQRIRNSQEQSPASSRRDLPRRTFNHDVDASDVQIPQFSKHSESRPRAEPPTPPVSRAQQCKQANLLGDEEVYISPARRRPPRTKEADSDKKPEVKLEAKKPGKSSTRPSTPAREFVAISPTALDMATSSRESGNEAFKLGDFSLAHEHYSKSLECIPQKHLLRPLLLSNLAACQIKLGDSKGALDSAVQGLAIIGPGLGAGEEAEPGKSLKDIWSKLATKQAEALENMEKFNESLETWDTLVNNGYSNATIIERRRRCQAAVMPRPASKPKSTTTSGRSTPFTPQTKAGKEALAKVQNIHKEQEKFETEKLALLDNVEARINAWRSGNEENLRVLISTLHTILWPELGWKQMSLAELVLPKKVKIAYMKAVAKTHPDKIPANATTEQKMISQAVFITLNKSWDGFKVSNGLA